MLVKIISYPSDPRICVITALVMMYLVCARYKCGDNNIRHWIIEPVSRRPISKGIMAVMHRSGINVVLFWPHSTSAEATSKASAYSLPLDQILSTSEHS